MTRDLAPAVAELLDQNRAMEFYDKLAMAKERWPDLSNDEWNRGFAIAFNLRLDAMAETQHDLAVLETHLFEKGIDPDPDSVPGPTLEQIRELRATINDPPVGEGERA